MWVSPAPTLAHDAVLVDLGDRLVIRLESGDAGDVLARPIGPVGDDAQRNLVAIRLEDDLARLDLQARELRRAVHRFGPAFEPSVEHVVFPTVGLDHLAPLVGDGQGRLLDDEAQLGHLDIDTVLTLGRQGVVVGLEVVAKQREAEAAGPLERAVAGPAVAADAAHQRQDVALKVRDLLDIGGREAVSNRIQHVGPGAGLDRPDGHRQAQADAEKPEESSRYHGEPSWSRAVAVAFEAD